MVERDDDRITLEYDHRADAWPFPYRARQEFLLTGDELRLSLSLENRGRETMPAGLGFHPYFPRTPGCRLSARVEAMWATDAEVMPTALVDADPRLGGEHGLPVADVPLDNAFTGWQQAGDDNLAGARRPARCSTPTRRSGSSSSTRRPAKDYFCVEPVSHCTDAFNLAAQGRADTGMLTLEAGASVSAIVRLRPSLE